MTASYNTSFFSTPATAASGVSKKGFRSTAYNNYVVDVVDFDNEIHTFNVEAESASEAQAEQAAEPSALAKAYESMKAKHPDAVLLYRCGDFYEAFAEDAKAVSDVLGITLTRTSRKDITAQMAGFPHYALDSYLPKLVRAGQRVGIGFFDIQTEREDDFYWLIRRSKLRILVAVEVKSRIVVKAISQIVDGIKPDFVRQMINGHVSSSAHITIADGGERGFKKLAKEYGSLTVHYGWGHLDRYFAGFKQWIEAEFNQRYSFKHLQGYLDEYNYRVSHRRNPQRNFDILMREAAKSLNKST